MKRAVFICVVFLALLTVGCGKTPPANGTLKGTVTIGPITPVERPGDNTPVSPEVFSARKIIVYKVDGITIIKTLDIQQIGQTATGTYEISLSPGVYVVGIKPNGIDRSGEVPKTITVESGKTIILDINIDTGIR